MTAKKSLNPQLKGASLMTKTYLIQAWCERPFITYLDPVEANSPEEAIAIARTQSKQLLDNAEECNAEYAWDEFAAHDEHGNELLHVLDEKARLHDAAPAMRDTLLYVAQELSAFKPDYLRQIGLNVVLEQVEKTLAIADNAATEASTPAPENDHE
jgi:hypothetical protein